MVKNFEEPALTLSKDGLRIASADVSAALEKKNLSASLITGLEGCHARWLFDTFVSRDLVAEEPDNAARRGSLFHKVMEDFFAIPPNERTKERLNAVVNSVLQGEEFKDMLGYPEAMQWLKQAIRNYYDMGARPEKVRVARIPEVTRDGRPYEKNGLEIFVKGNIGGTKRDILGFIDRLVVDQRRVDEALIIEDWKGLALDTLLPTMDGWTTMGEVKVGDKILGTQGKEVAVLEKSKVHHRPCYRITFFDGSSVVADNEHLWEVRLANDPKRKLSARNAVLSTDEMYKEWKDGRRDYVQIKNPEAIEFSERDLPIHPYVLGAWLGDGHNRDGRIASGRDDYEEMVVNLQRNWPGHVDSYLDGPNRTITLKKDPNRCAMNNTSCGKTYATLCNDCKTIKINKSGIRSNAVNVPLAILLRRNNLLHNKHVPIMYLRSSISQRVELLRGLMDTDGYWHPKRKRALFYTADKALASAVQEIVASLGITPTIYRGENDHKGFYEVGFSPVNFNPFLLSRKAVLVDEHLKQEGYRTHKSLHRIVREITPIDSVPTQCVKVDAENSLYLCGPLLTPTHNTGAKVKRWKAHTKSTDGLGETRQQVIYSMLLEQRDLTVSGARLIYPVAKEIVDVNLRDEEFKDRVVEDVKHADAALDVLQESNEFAFTPGFLCSWCALVNICPSADRKGFDKAVKAREQQPSPDILKQAIEVL